MYDSSPQSGWNLFMVYEWRMVIDRNLDITVLARMLINGKIPKKRRTLPCSCLGHGAATLPQKMCKMTHLHGMEAGSYEAIMEETGQVIGGTSDRGVEKLIADVPNTLPENIDDLNTLIEGMLSGEVLGPNFVDGAAGYLYPKCLYMNGHLHMLYNSLQAAISKRPNWKEHVRRLRHVNNFFKSRGLRVRIQELCLRDQPLAVRQAFDSFSGVDVDEKWEWVSKLTIQLRRLWPMLLLIDLQKLKSGHSAEDEDVDQASLDSKSLGVVMELQHDLKFPCENELLHGFGEATDEAAGWIEGCKCHSHIWTAGGSWSKRRRTLFAFEGIPDCPCKGCRGREMATPKGDKDRLINSIAHGANVE